MPVNRPVSCADYNTPVQYRRISVKHVRQKGGSVMAAQVRAKGNTHDQRHIAFPRKGIDVLHSEHDIILLKTGRILADDVKVLEIGFRRL